MVTLLTGVILAASAQAGVPSPRVIGLRCFPSQQLCPDRCTLVVLPSSAPCQYQFGVSALDPITVLVTLRDAFNNPIADCSTKVTLAPNAGTQNFCSCCPVSQTVLTDAAGGVAVTFDGIGGYGTLGVTVTGFLLGTWPLFNSPITYTSSDYNGSCEGAASTTVADLGKWAVGLGVYQTESDFDCSGTVNIIDLGRWAQG
ncbi:MAG: Ig-like domain-containing protein, partial [Gemmatimonadetes bacterium]|nr:Ig-like domain-containing protein [Gemmatimonadota bacterium]